MRPHKDLAVQILLGQDLGVCHDELVPLLGPQIKGKESFKHQNIRRGVITNDSMERVFCDEFHDVVSTCQVEDDTAKHEVEPHSGP